MLSRKQKAEAEKSYSTSTIFILFIDIISYVKQIYITTTDSCCAKKNIYYE